MSKRLITYERGSTYVTNVKDGKICHGLVGELWIGGLCFDTLERYDPEVTIHLPKRDYTQAVMYWHTAKRKITKDGQTREIDVSKRRVIHPWAGKAPSQKQENILVHYGTRPSHFEGCIGVGFLERAGSSQELRYDSESLEVIWEHAGGKPGNRDFWNAASPVVVFRVLNDFPNIKTLKPHSG